MSLPGYMAQNQSFSPPSRGGPDVDMDGHSMQTPMKLKVLYTFDEAAKSNCLARWPETLLIRTAVTEEGVQIGVVNLSTCIQAVVSSSPEILGRDRTDFMVYAFDYSEDDTPLVGQGKLLDLIKHTQEASSASEPDEAAIVTGRVAISKMSVFSQTTFPILEVKLRLMPVLPPRSIAPSNAVNIRGTLRRSMSASLDSRQRPGTPPSSTVTAEFLQRSLEHPLNVVLPNSTATRSFELPSPHAVSPAFTENDRLDIGSLSSLGLPRPEPRSPTFINPPLPRHTVSSRPGSRNGQREQLQTRPMSENAPYDALSPDSEYSGEFLDSGRARKRARVTSAQWNTDDLLGLNQERLRVSASGAASVRDLRRIRAASPVQLMSASSTEPGRPPTPRPRGKALDYAPRPQQQSRLREISSNDLPMDSDNDAEFSDIWQSIESQGPSPRYRQMHSAPSTPMDLPSSPTRQITENPSPVFAHVIHPQHPLNPRSETREPGAFPFEGEVDPILDHESILNLETSPAGEETRMAPTARGRHVTPLKSQEWRNAPSGQSGRTHPPVRRPRSSSTAEGPRRSAAEKAARRKQLIKERLAVAVDSGEVPEYCSHCGSIETPSWRKAWIKEVPELNYRMEGSDEYRDQLIYEDILNPATQLPQGTKIILKSHSQRTVTDPGFEEVMLCNPCGLYLHKNRRMRPGSCWSKSTEPRPKKGRAGDGSRRSSLSRGSDRLRPTLDCVTSDINDPNNGEANKVREGVSTPGPTALSDDIIELRDAMARMESPRSRERTRLEATGVDLDDARKGGSHQVCSHPSLAAIPDLSIVQSDTTPDPPSQHEPALVPIFSTPRRPSPRPRSTPTPVRGLLSSSTNNASLFNTPRARSLIKDDQDACDETPFTRELNQFFSDIHYSPSKPLPLDSLSATRHTADSEFFTLPDRDILNSFTDDLPMTVFNVPSSPPLPRSPTASSWDNLFGDGASRGLKCRRGRASSPTPRGKRSWPDAFDATSDTDDPLVERTYCDGRETLLREVQNERSDGGEREDLAATAEHSGAVVEAV